MSDVKCITGGRKIRKNLNGIFILLSSENVVFQFSRFVNREINKLEENRMLARKKVG